MLWKKHQACLTDGRVFTNYWYQLNSCDLRHHGTDPDTKSNVLWVGEDKVEWLYLKLWVFVISMIIARSFMRKWRMENLSILIQQPWNPWSLSILHNHKKGWEFSWYTRKARNISFHLQEKYDPIPWRYKPGIWTSRQLPEKILQKHPQASVHQQVSVHLNITQDWKSFFVLNRAAILNW